jgi:hypothetical protein
MNTRKREREPFRNLDPQAFFEDCGRPLDRQRELKVINKRVRWLQNEMENHGYEPTKRDIECMAENFVEVLDMIAHMEMGLIDIYRLTFPAYSPHHYGCEVGPNGRYRDNEIIDAMVGIGRILELIAPYERRNLW